jgi:hypothetical protein
MKPKDYVSKYKLNVSNKFNHNHFVQDLTNDFLSLLEVGKTASGEFRLKGFENSVRAIRQKWDGIDKKTVYGLPDKLWGYFYAKVIVKMRENLFPEQMKAKREEAERRKRMWEQRRREEDEMFNDWSNFFYQSLFASIFQGMQKPTSSFDELGLSSDASKDDVTKAYRKLSMKHHPDVGGKQEDFLRITEAKNKCITYLESV